MSLAKKYSTISRSIKKIYTKTEKEIKLNIKKIDWKAIFEMTSSTRTLKFKEYILN